MGRPRSRDRLRGAEAVEPGRVVLGVIASPGPCSDLAEALLPELAEHVAARVPGVRWEIRYVSDRLVQGPADLSQLVSAARKRALVEGWQLVVCISDLPLQTARRPVVAHASMTHGVAVLSLPALGPVAVARRACQAVTRLIAALLGDGIDGGGIDGDEVDRTGADRAEADRDKADRDKADRDKADRDKADRDKADRAATGRGVDTRRSRGRRRRRQALLSRRAKEIGGRVERDEHGFRLVAGVVTGNLRLLLGMLRANRPWRLAVRLSDALVAALATGVLAIVLSDIWRIADGSGPLRLSMLALGSVVAVVLAIIVGARLWERAPPGTTAREQVILFNVVTAATVVIGVLTLYLALLVMLMIGALLLVPGNTVAQIVGHSVGIGGQFKLAWLGASLATVAGALGAGLESDEAVREAAYGYQPDRQLSRG